MKKKLLSMCLGILMVAMLLPSALSEEVSAETYAGDSASTATTISMDTTYTGSVSATNPQDFYKFTLPTFGTLDLDFAGKSMDVMFYNVIEGTVWFFRGDSTEQINAQKTFYLTSGNYCLAVIATDETSQSYRFRFSFAGAGENSMVVESNGTPSDNCSDQNYLYGNWSSPMKSHVYQNEDETLVRVESIDSYVLIETYTKNGQTVLSKKTVDKELDIFGGCFIGEKYNFLVFGQENPGNSEDCEVVRVVKYTKNWTKMDDCRIAGVNTTIPFAAGSLRMAEDDGKLYIHTCHQMYSGHQANMTFKVDQDTMNLDDSMHDVVWFSYGYISHSFNQFIETDGTYIFRVDHGDAYNRGISISKFHKDNSSMKGSYTLPVAFAGEIGDNYTGAAVGGFELGENNCIISYSFVDYYSSYTNRNIKVSITDKSFNSTKIVDITNYTEEDNIDCLTPQLIKINNNLFLILWEERDAQGNFTTSAATIDENGNILSISCNKAIRLSDCQPILCNDQKVRWYTTCNSSPIWYTIDPYNLHLDQLGLTDVEIGGRAADALRINWTKNSAAAGYIIEQYKSGEWVRIARIAGNATTTYRVEKLSPNTTYQFRIKAFDFEGDTAVYGEYTSVSGKTNPSIMTGTKIAGRAADALRINWNRNNSASGYIIEQYTAGKWVRIARISGNATTTYRVENLTPSTTYQFRIQAFNFDGSTALYGNYAYVSGKTNPSVMTGVRIAGWASDALRINWNRNNSASGYIIEQYTAGKWVRIARISGNATTTYRVEKLSPGTTYQFRIQAFGFDGSTALYGASVSVSGKTTGSASPSPSVVSGLKIGGRAADALRLNWSKSANADGYIVEQYKNGAWVRIARIGSGSTLTYRVENLSASTTYKFRVKAFAMNGSTAVYSGYTYVNGKTNPSVMTGVRIAGWASDALRINWNRNNSASGYIIEQYTDGKWVRIARISGNATTTYRVEKLSPGTTYQFRIRAFGFDGSTALYGSYAYADGTTLK